MPSYSQDNRSIRIETALGPDELILTRFTGQEGVSRPFLYQIEMRSENDAINAKDLLRTPATIVIGLDNGEERHIHGVIRRFSQHGSDPDKLTSYRAEIVPWFWFLSLSRDCKVFQNKSVLEILEDVFKGLGYNDYDIRCLGTYAKREYCVQYRESHLNFVSRLMEEEGIFYFFKHEANKHTLVVTDANSKLTACPYQSQARVAQQTGTEGNVITEMHGEHSVFIGKVTVGEYDYLQPALSLRSSSQGEGREEAYDYLPVSYTTREDGDRYARLQLEAEEAMQQVIRGVGSCSFMQSGYTFNLKEHYRDDVNTTYLLLEVHHSAAVSEYRSAGASGVEYTNEFAAMPHAIIYRAPRRAMKPSMVGAQSAVVVGPAGEEIHVDKHGRVKVQFHWDRLGTKNEKSSCWVRVSSNWAGKGWGVIHIPRIGQEVLVDFLEGDVDRPVIVGRLYNAEQVPPYALPDNGTQSGVKSRSSPRGGTDNHNEIRLEDKKGSELFYEQAEKDMEILVKNDRKEEVKRDETIKIGRDRTEEVTRNEKVTIKGNRTHEVKGDDKLDVTKKIVITAQTGIEFKVGSSEIKITPAGIEMKAVKIKIEGMGAVEITAPSLKGSGTAMTEMTSSGILTLRGSLVKIN
ncbi:MAG: type VI secretion system Vgr family protein [Longimicrobiales bacterium]